MTVRVSMRENQQKSWNSQPLQTEWIAGRASCFYLHLIRRDGRGGLFLPSNTAVRAAHANDQKGHAA